MPCQPLRGCTEPKVLVTYIYYYTVVYCVMFLFRVVCDWVCRSVCWQHLYSNTINEMALSTLQTAVFAICAACESAEPCPVLAGTLKNTNFTEFNFTTWINHPTIQFCFYVCIQYVFVPFCEGQSNLVYNFQILCQTSWVRMPLCPAVSE